MTFNVFIRSLYTMPSKINFTLNLLSLISMLYCTLIIFQQIYSFLLKLSKNNNDVLYIVQCQCFDNGFGLYHYVEQITIEGLEIHPLLCPIALHVRNAEKGCIC